VRPRRSWPVFVTLVCWTLPFAAAAFAASPPQPGSAPRAAAAPAAPRATQGAPGPKVDWSKFPQADTAAAFAGGRTPTTQDTSAELVLDDGGVDFGADGTEAFVSTKVYLVKSRAGVQELSELPGVPRVEGARAVSFVIHDSGVREGGKVNNAGAVTFDHLVPGDVVYVHTEVAVPGLKSGARPPISSPTLLRGAYPARLVRFWVRYPANRPAGARSLGLPEPVTRADGPCVIKEWRAENLDRLPAEPDAVGALEGAPVVMLDASPDPDWLAPVLRSYLRQPAGPRLKKLVARIKAQQATPLERLEAARDSAYRRVATSGREIASPESLARLTAERVLTRGASGPYGRLALLLGLLRGLGLSPGVAVVEPQRLWLHAPAVAPAYVRCLVAVPWDKPVMWLNPSSLAAPAERVDRGFQGLRATLIGPTATLGDVPVPVSPGETRGTTLTMLGALDSAGVIAGTARYCLEADDADAQRALMRGLSMRAAADVMQKMIGQALFGAEIRDLKGEGFETAGDSCAMISSFRALDLLDVSGAERSLRMPGRLVPELEPAPRTTPRSMLGVFGSHTQRVALDLPPRWALAGGADSASGGGTCIRWAERRWVADGRLHLERRTTVLRPELQPGEMQTYLSEQTAMVRSFDRPVVLRVTP